MEWRIQTVNPETDAQYDIRCRFRGAAEGARAECQVLLINTVEGSHLRTAEPIQHVTAEPYG